jgi:2-polyprenyl-3-methyl-5-hydroxy-6-metoxy-1,4-benzoquinol methylase
LYTNRVYCERQILHAAHAGRIKEARWRLDQVEGAAPRRGRLLDVGCSAASFLLAARDRGWDVAGLDISPGAVEHARSMHGLAAAVGTIEESNLPPRSFDVVTMFECIEHMRHPAATLRATRRVLERHGLVVITTPNIDGLVPRVTYRLLAQTIGAWEHPTPPHHLYQFSRRTLAALLRTAGFDVISIATRPMGLRYTVRQMESAVIDAIRRRYGRGALAAQPGAPPPPAPRRRRTFWRRMGRRLVSGGCWLLTGALYTIPVARFGLGDSMIVVARKQ